MDGMSERGERNEAGVWSDYVSSLEGRLTAEEDSQGNRAHFCISVIWLLPPFSLFMFVPEGIMEGMSRWGAIWRRFKKILVIL